MITVRQIDRLWSAKAYDRLLEQLVSPRPESSDRLLSQLTGSLPAAAMAIIRLDELSQSFAPLYSQLVRTIIAAQNKEEGSIRQSSGGWGDVTTTALCLRALLCGNGNGQSIERGFASLAGLQKPEGIWPCEPVRRMPVDAYASAFALLQLGDRESFRKAVRLDDAVEWFESNQLALDEPTAKLWARAKMRLPISVKQKASRSVAMDQADLSDSFWSLADRTGNPRGLQGVQN